MEISSEMILFYYNLTWSVVMRRGAEFISVLTVSAYGTFAHAAGALPAPSGSSKMLKFRTKGRFASSTPGITTRNWTIPDMISRWVWQLNRLHTE
jgi:hypothetical protein